jgi:hypothetical protein
MSNFDESFSKAQEFTADGWAAARKYIKSLIESGDNVSAGIVGRVYMPGEGYKTVEHENWRRKETDEERAARYTQAGY